LRGTNRRGAFFVLEKLAQKNPHYGLPLIAGVQAVEKPLHKKFIKYFRAESHFK